MVIMSVDLGHVRTGLAVSDEFEMLASPAGTIKEGNPVRIIEKIVLKIQEFQPQEVVIGLPKNMDGTEGESARNARYTAQEIERICGIPVRLWDERLTTKIAHTYLNSTDTRGKKRKAVVDTVAATIILQDYLDFRRNKIENKDDI